MDYDDHKIDPRIYIQKAKALTTAAITIPVSIFCHFAFDIHNF